MWSACGNYVDLLVVLHTDFMKPCLLVSSILLAKYLAMDVLFSNTRTDLVMSCSRSTTIHRIEALLERPP